MSITATAITSIVMPSRVMMDNTHQGYSTEVSDLPSLTSPLHTAIPSGLVPLPSLPVTPMTQSNFVETVSITTWNTIALSPTVIELHRNSTTSTKRDSVSITISHAPVTTTQPNPMKPSASMLPLWIWVIIIVIGLFIVTLIVILCTIFCYMRRPSRKKEENSSTLKCQRESKTTLVNGFAIEDVSNNIESVNNESIEAILSKERPVRRWDSLRVSWSRRSSRKKFSTFKPQQYAQEQQKQDDQNTFATTNNHSKESWNIPEPNTHRHQTLPNYARHSYSTSALLPSGYSAKPFSNPLFGNMNGVGGEDYFGNQQRNSQFSPDYHHNNSCYVIENSSTTYRVNQ